MPDLAREHQQTAPLNDPSVPFIRAASFLQVVRQAESKLAVGFVKDVSKRCVKERRRKAYHAGASKEP